MKANTRQSTIWAFVLTVIPFAYLAYLWNTLPETFVSNNGKSDRIVLKEHILENLINMAIFGLAMYFVLAYYKTYDPKQSITRSKNLLVKFGLMHVAFFSALSVYVIHTEVHHEFNNFILILTGLMITAWGNLLHSLPFRHPLGMRLPWLLENEDIWRKTHRLASKIYFFTGLSIVAEALLMQGNRIEPRLMAFVLIPMFIPHVYAYRLSKNVTQ
jgi:uncharacterized membrane protein